MNTSHVIDPDIDNLRRAMERGEARFLYLKKDGTVREARGTLCAALIPRDRRPRGLRTPPANVFTYFDKERTAWRCFRRERIIGLLLEDG